MPSVLYMPPYVVHDNQIELGPKQFSGSKDDVTFFNGSNVDVVYVPHPHHLMAYVIFYVNCCTFSLGLLGNFLLILMYGRNTTVRTATNTYILSIAITDLLVTLTCALTPILTDLAGTWPFSERTCKLSQALMEFSTFATVLTLTAISVERYYAVLYPIEKHISTKSFTVTVNSIVWGVSLLLAVPKYMNAGVKTHKVDGIQGHTTVAYCVINQDHTPFSRYLSLFDFVAFYTVPLIIVSVLYTGISRHLMRTTAEVSSRTRMTPGQVNLARMRYKVAKMVIVLTAIFFVGFLPHNILILRIFLLEVTDSYWNSAASYAYCYGCLHFWLNPIALYICSDAVRKHFNEYLFCATCPWKSNRTSPQLCEPEENIKTHL